MTVPDEAIEAAAKAAAKDEDASNWHDESEYYRNGWRNRMQVGLEAAAPYLRAQALGDAADEFHARLPDGTGNGRAYNAHQVAWMLRARAAAERGGE